MPKYIIDCETDGLLDTVSKIHVIGWHNLETGKSGVILKYDMMIKFLTQPDLTLICHNLHRYDKVVFRRILGIELGCRIIDSLALSWYLEPNRNSHGLEGYGIEFGVLKPKVEDWSTQPIETYINRVSEDVKINLRLFLMQLAKLKFLYNGGMKAVARCINYLSYKLDCAEEQERIRWKLDKELCEENLRSFEQESLNRTSVLSNIMPRSVKYKNINKPKKMLKKDGSISKKGENWLSLLADLGLNDDEEGPLKLEKSTEIGNPGSHQQLKEWLFELGWTPTTFKYEQEPSGKMRKIPQISLPRGEGLCPSVKRLYTVEPHLEELDMYYVIKHRIGILKGFLRDVSDDGYLQAKVSGLTNTLRFKHSEIVNLPGVTGKGDWKDGSHIRGCLVAPEGYVLCGSDMSSLENRTGEHYMYYFDKEYVNERNDISFCSHLDMAKTADMMTKNEEEFYNWYNNKNH
jgi:hypothetical protein